MANNRKGRARFPRRRAFRALMLPAENYTRHLPRAFLTLRLFRPPRTPSGPIAAPTRLSQSSEDARSATTGADTYVDRCGGTPRVGMFDNKTETETLKSQNASGGVKCWPACFVSFSIGAAQRSICRCINSEAKKHTRAHTQARKLGGGRYFASLCPVARER